MFSLSWGRYLHSALRQNLSSPQGFRVCDLNSLDRFGMKDLKQVFALALILITSVSLGFSQATLVSYSEEDDRRITFQEISYASVGDSLVTYQQALHSFRQGKFTLNQNPDLNLGIAKDNYWIAFTIMNVNDFENSIYAVLENPRLNEVDVYLIQNDSIVNTFILGDNFPYHQRPLYFNEFSFPIELSPGTEVTVLLHLKHKGNTLQMPIRILSINAFLEHIEGDYLFSGIVSGIFIITFLFGIFFLFNTRDRLFFFYSAYILTALAWLWTTEGFAFQYLWPNHPELATRLGPGLSAVSACFFAANALQFCKPYDSTSLPRKILTGFLIFLILWSSTPFLPFVPITETSMAIYLTVYFSSNIIIATMLMSYLLWLSMKGNKVVLYFFAAVLVTIISSLAIVLRGSGIINIPLASSTVMSIGYVLEVILMTAGITKQFYNYRKEKEATLIAYLDQQKSITDRILQTQEIERVRIGRELHDDIGAGLTQISLMSEVIKDQNDFNTVHRKELNDITLIARKLIHSMGEIVWALNPENKSLEQLMIYLREQLGNLLEYSGIEFSIQLPNVDRSVSLNNIQLRNTMLITKELVNNAVKYSQAKNILVFCEWQTDRLIFKIQDDGIGADLATVKKGNGLKNIMRRVNELGGKFEINSSPGKGTRCHFTVPLWDTSFDAKL